MKKCPYCAEEIQEAAVKCRHCGEFLGEQTTQVAPSPKQVTAANLVGPEAAVKASAEAAGLPPGKMPFAIQSNFGCLSICLLACITPVVGMSSLLVYSGAAKVDLAFGYIAGLVVFFLTMIVVYRFIRKYEEYLSGYCPACLKPTMGKGDAFNCELCTARIVVNYKERTFEVPGIVVKNL